MDSIPTGAFTLIATLVGVLGAFAVQRFVAFRAASAKFRTAVIGELGALYPHVGQWPSDIDAFLRRAFPNLQVAVAEFSESLPKRRRAEFLAAWHAFHCDTGRAVDSQVYHHYMPFHSNSNPQATFQANVARLLAFARET